MPMYTAQFNAVAATVQQDIFEIVGPASGSVVLHRIVVSQSTEVGDAAEEGLLLLIKKGQTTTGSGGSTVTPVDIGLGATTFGGTVKANNTAKASAGTIVTLHAEAWNVRSVFDWLPTPECRIVLQAAQRATLELATTPADSITLSGTLYFELI